MPGTFQIAWSILLTFYFHNIIWTVYHFCPYIHLIFHLTAVVNSRSCNNRFYCWQSRKPSLFAFFLFRCVTCSSWYCEECYLRQEHLAHTVEDPSDIPTTLSGRQFIETDGWLVEKGNCLPSSTYISFFKPILTLTCLERYCLYWSPFTFH